MPRVLLDTSVASYIIKGDSRADRYLDRLKELEPVISFMTLAELYRWPIRKHWGQRKTEVFVNSIRSYPILPFHERVCWYWAQLMDAKGRPMPASDAWIGATALAYQLPMASHNGKDFAHIKGLQLIWIP